MIYYLKLFVITEESEDSEGTLFSSGSEGFRPRSNYSYVIVGDNLDKNIRPRHMTSDHQTQSVHYFHCYAVQDRVDFHHLSNDEPMSQNWNSHVFFQQLMSQTIFGEIMQHYLEG